MTLFTQQVARWAEGTKKLVDQDVRAIELALFAAVIKSTPVDTGRARANWQASIDEPILVATDDVDPTGDATIAQVLQNLAGAGHVTWLSNNLPYIAMLEYGGYPDPPKHGSRVKGGGYVVKTEGGYSRQAPAGFVRINMARISEIVREALAS